TSLKNAKTILIGGMDRGIDYDILKEFIKDHSQYNYILMYETGKRIMKELGGEKNVYLVEDLKEAVLLAKKITRSKEACVLSPAAASYGYFKNFEDRGDVFKQLVMS
ncbi:MAG: UDP-N-acetylmuramoyl-L-alanine--D-glutamate ligase, partial [Lachnospiraceae bacterium]|nr:UDP-N-acetylmuramoyl-L-alanine--D-glutamate ligase [Lachnospiraceae bacterium]